MSSGRQEHAHEHRIVEIVDSENMTAFEQAPDGFSSCMSEGMMELGFREVPGGVEFVHRRGHSPAAGSKQERQTTSASRS